MHLVRVMEFRQDFYPGSTLYKFVSEVEEQPRRKKTPSKFRKYSTEIYRESRSLTR